MEQQNDFIPKLGIIAISFGNGSIGIYVVPKPNSIRKRLNLPPNETLFGNNLIFFYLSS